jgi:hypothetical protein
MDQLKLEPIAGSVGFTTFLSYTAANWKHEAPDLKSLCEKMLKELAVPGHEALDPLWHCFPPNFERSNLGPAYAVELTGSRGSPRSVGKYNRNLLESERRKSLRMAENRTLLASRTGQEDLASENAALRDAVFDLAKANKALQSAIGVHVAGRLCLLEFHRGVVTEIIGEQVEVTYDTPEGPLKQIYNCSQFMNGKIPNEGDRIEASVTVAVIERGQAEGEESNFDNDLPSFKDRATSGPIRI